MQRKGCPGKASAVFGLGGLLDGLSSFAMLPPPTAIGHHRRCWFHFPLLSSLALDVLPALGTGLADSPTGAGRLPGNMVGPFWDTSPRLGACLASAMPHGCDRVYPATWSSCDAMPASFPPTRVSLLVVVSARDCTLLCFCVV